MTPIRLAQHGDRYNKLVSRTLLFYLAIPQAFGSSGAHIGVGRALLRATVTFLEVEAEEIWVEATAPVRTRAATTARTMIFMICSFESNICVENSQSDANLLSERFRRRSGRRERTWG